MAKYASGKHAFRQCKCGFKVPYQTARLEKWSGLYACAECWDPDPNIRRKAPIDAQALRNPRPDQDKMGVTLGGRNAPSAELFLEAGEPS